LGSPLLCRSGESVSGSRSSSPPAFVGLDESQQILSYCSLRFGIPPEAFHGYRFLRIGSTIWAASAVPGLQEAIRELKVETAGIPLIRTRISWWKPPTSGLQVLGEKATRNVVELDDEQLETFLRKEPIGNSFQLSLGM